MYAKDANLLYNLFDNIIEKGFIIVRLKMILLAILAVYFSKMKLENCNITIFRLYISLAIGI